MVVQGPSRSAGLEAAGGDSHIAGGFSQDYVVTGIGLQDGVVRRGEGVDSVLSLLRRDKSRQNAVFGPAPVPLVCFPQGHGRQAPGSVIAADFSCFEHITGAVASSSEFLRYGNGVEIMVLIFAQVADQFLQLRRVCGHRLRPRARHTGYVHRPHPVVTGLAGLDRQIHQPVER